MDRRPDDELRLLMRWYQEGDEQAFRALYMNTAGSIERYLRRWSDASRVHQLRVAPVHPGRGAEGSRIRAVRELFPEEEVSRFGARRRKQEER